MIKSPGRADSSKLITVVLMKSDVTIKIFCQPKVNRIPIIAAAVVAMTCDDGW